MIIFAGADARKIVFVYFLQNKRRTSKSFYIRISNLCLQDSNNSVEQELYRRMMEFAQDDPNILSQDYNVHLSKMLSENYAYIGDSPFMELWAAEHCEIAMLPVKLTGLEYYSILLTKDSAFTADIDNVYVILNTAQCG